MNVIGFISEHNERIQDSIKKNIGMKLEFLSFIFICSVIFIGNVYNSASTYTASKEASPTKEIGETGLVKENVGLKSIISTNLLDNTDSKNIKICVALSGGAAKGLAHIGVIKALEEAGIKIDYIAGSSIGALIGAAYASGVPIDTLKKIAVSTNWKTAAKLFIPGLSTSGLIDGKRVKQFLSTLYGDKNIEDLPIPFAATATDISNGKLFIINRGSLLEAVRASISIPVVFTTVKYRDTFLVDGGLAGPLPIDVVREMGADFVIAVHVLHSRLPSKEREYIRIENLDIEREKSPTLENLSNQMAEYLKIIEGKKVNKKSDEKQEYPKITKISQSTLWIAQDVIAQLQIELYKPDLVIEPGTRSISLYEFYRGEEAIDIGYKAAVEALEEGHYN